MRLILYHGRMGYVRVARMICYYFYKNIVLVFTEMYFPFYNGFSGQIFFLDWLPMMFNAVFTSWYCLFSQLLEKDVNDQYSYRYPVVYKAGQLGKYFNYKIFWKWIIIALIHGIISFYFPLMVIIDVLIDLGREIFNIYRKYRNNWRSLVTFTSQFQHYHPSCSLQIDARNQTLQCYIFGSWNIQHSPLLWFAFIQLNS